MTKQSFFNEAKEQSIVKTAIVEKYFNAWSRVILPWAKQRGGKIAYIDLFAGPGRYDDGTKSTPIKVLEQAIADNEMRSMLVSFFNDVDEANAEALRAEVNTLPGIETLSHAPQINSAEVGADAVRLFEEIRLVPTLFFIDPWGYKGLSLALVQAVIKDWGCDCIFFFNYTRINMGIRNPLVVNHMNDLFGEERAERLRSQLGSMTSPQREASIVEAISEALNPKADRYVLPFRFKRPDGSRTSHHLIFVTKHIRGYEIMKEIMARESSESTQGVASFEYNPAVLNQGLLFSLSRPLDELEGDLLIRLAGRRMTMKEVYESHHIGTRYIKRNYKTALMNLEMAGRIQATPPRQDRNKNTFADHVRVSFPSSALPANG